MDDPIVYIIIAVILFSFTLFSLIILLSNWGPCVGCEVDLNGDGVVNTIDLVQLLSTWGTCF